MVLLQMDIDVRELRELNENAIQKMNEVIKKHPEMAADVKEKLLRASIIFLLFPVYVASTIFYIVTWAFIPQFMFLNALMTRVY